MEIKLCLHSFGYGFGVATIACLGFWAGYSMSAKMSDFRDCPEGQIAAKMSYADGEQYQRCVQNYVPLEPKRKKRR